VGIVRGQSLTKENNETHKARGVYAMSNEIEKDYCLICRREIRTESGQVCCECAETAKGKGKLWAR